MRRTTLLLDERLEHNLKAVSRRQGRPMAVVAREAIAEYVTRVLREPTHVSFTAAGTSGRPDTADTHEDGLWAALTPHGGGRDRAPRALTGSAARSNRRVSRKASQ